MLVLTQTIPGEGGVCACTFEPLLLDAVLVLALLVLAVDDVEPAEEELPDEGLFAAVCGVAAVLPDAAVPGAGVVDELDAVPASPFFFYFLLFVDLLVELVS